MVIYDVSSERVFKQVSFGPVKVAKMGDRAVIFIPRKLRDHVLGKHVLVTLTILD